MIFLAVVGAVIVVALGAAAWYDHRVKRRGGRLRAYSGVLPRETMRGTNRK